MRIALAMVLIVCHSMFPVARAADPALGPAAQSQREFATAYAHLGSMKVSVARAYASFRRFPPTYQEAQLEGPVEGPHFTIELGKEGVLTIKFNERAQPDLAGAEFAAVPTINEMGDMIWYCLAPKIPRHISLQRCL